MGRPARACADLSAPLTQWIVTVHSIKFTIGFGKLLIRSPIAATEIVGSERLTLRPDVVWRQFCSSPPSHTLVLERIDSPLSRLRLRLRS
jgi:hypothetical protein